jgi:CRISPR-associated protein Csd1
MLHHLLRYAQKNLADSEPGFTTRSVRWQVEITANGELINVVPLGDDKKGLQMTKCPDMPAVNSGGRSHFLIESMQTVALHFKNNETEAKKKTAGIRHNFFLEMINSAATTAVELNPLSAFLQNQAELTRLRERCEAVKAKPSDWMCWRVAGHDPLKQAAVLDWWRSRMSANCPAEMPKHKEQTATEDGLEKGTGEMLCFLTGEITKPILTHPKVGGLSSVGGLGTKDVLVGFDKDAFRSYGFIKSMNAAVESTAARGYVDALEHLINNHSHKLANALVVHWFKEAVKLEYDPLAFLYEPPEVTEGAAQQSVRETLESLRKGLRPVPLNNLFYAMTLSGASGRVMVRDWMERSFEELVARIEQWFADFEIVAQSEGQLARDPKFNEVCLSMVRYDKAKSYFDNLNKLPAPLATTLWRVALAGLPIPQPFIAQALARFRADLIDDKPFNHARMGLIKAYFIRKGGDHYMSAYLNKEHPEPAYHCGRLLAMLASLQRAALGDVGAGVVQRYYVGASQTPGLALGRLVGYAKNHLNKLEGGLAHWYEGQIAEIMSRIQDRIPATLDLEHQSLFALGYYQQIAANRAGKNTKTNETKEGGN